MRHPAEFFIRYLLVKDPIGPDAEVLRVLDQWSFLSPEPNYLGFLRQELPPRPAGFDPLNRLHRPSMAYLRDQQVYDLFYPTPAVEEAWSILSDPTMRMTVEQILLARLDLRTAVQKVNRKNNWFLTVPGLEMYRHYFWNVKLLTFDEWGRFLYGRSALYERYLGLLQASPQLAFFHLRLDQTLESKQMIRRAQEIAYFTLEEVNQKPGSGPDKVKAIAMLTKSLVDCHEAQSTSDMALKEVLKQFERFRMEHPQMAPKSIRELAAKGNYSGSGIKETVEVLEADKEDV